MDQNIYRTRSLRDLLTTKEDGKSDNSKKETEKTNRNLDLIQPTLDGSKHEHQLQKESLQWHHQQ